MMQKLELVSGDHKVRVRTVYGGGVKDQWDLGYKVDSVEVEVQE